MTKTITVNMDTRDFTEAGGALKVQWEERNADHPFTDSFIGETVISIRGTENCVDPKCKDARICRHTGAAIFQGADTPLIGNGLNTKDLEEFGVEVPLFQADPSAGWVTVATWVRRKYSASGMPFGVVTTVLPTDSPAILLDGDQDAGMGRKRVKLGVVTPLSSIYEITGMVSSWILTQSHIVPKAQIECSNFSHEVMVRRLSKDFPVSEGMNISSVILTGLCLVCANASRNVSSDVPVV